MEDKGLKIGKWLYAATGGIPFTPDREAVRLELKGHLEDKVFDLMRCFPDMTEEEAVERALGTMGDADEIGKELARIHRPWWGWLWRASKWVLWAAAGWLTVLLLLNSSWRGSDPKFFTSIAARFFPDVSSPTHARLITAGVNPYGPEGTEPDPEKARELTLLAAVEETAPLQVGHYRLKVDRGALWRSEGELPTLYLRLEALGLPWEELGYSPLASLTATDEEGNHYYSSAELFREGSTLVPSEVNHLMAGWSDTSPDWMEVYYLELFRVPEDVNWLRLEYDRAGVKWSIKVPLKEVD